MQAGHAVGWWCIQTAVPLLVQLRAVSAELLHNVLLTVKLLLSIICSFLQPLHLQPVDLMAWSLFP